MKAPTLCKGLIPVVEQCLESAEIGAVRGRRNSSDLIIVIPEHLDHGREFGGVGDEVDMAAGVQVQDRIWQKPVHDTGVDKGTTGSSIPAMINVRCRVAGNANMLVHTALSA